MSDNEVVDAIRNFSTSSSSPENMKKTLREMSGASQYESLKRGSVETNLISAKRRATEVGQAGMQLLTMGFEAVGAIPEGATADYTNKIAEEARAYAKTPYAAEGGLGQLLVDVAVALPLIALNAPLAATVRGGVALGAFEGLTRPAYSQKDVNLLNPERMKNVALSSLAGGGGAYLSNKLLSPTAVTIQQKTATAPFNIIEKRALEGIQKEAAKEATDAAKKLNTFVTPAEATKDALAVERESGLQLFGKAKRKLNTTLEEREKTLQANINEIVAGIVPEGTDAARATARQFSESTYRTPFPLVAEFAAENKILQTAYDAIRGTGRREFIRRSGGMIDIKPNTVGDLHLMRLYVDDLIKEAKAKKAGIAEFAQARNDLLAMADTFAPEYALSRNINQRLLLQDKIVDTLNKAKKNDPRGTTSSFYNNYLENTAKTDKFMAELNNITDDAVRENIIRNVNAIEPVLKAINKSPLDTSLKAATRQAEARAAGVGGARGVVLNLVTNVTDGLLDNELVGFITSPNWIGRFDKLAANKTQTQKNDILLKLFYEYIGKVSPTIAASIQQGKSAMSMQQEATPQQ